MDHAGEVFANSLIPPLIAIVLGAVALGFGAFLCQLFYIGRRPPFVESFALGSLAVSLLTLLWGALGWMGVSARWTLALVLLLLGVVGWIRPGLASPLNTRTFRNRTILILMLLLSVTVVLKVVLLALYPPYAPEECTTYLPTALDLLKSGRMTYDPSIALGSMPQYTEMLYAWALSIRPLSNAHYVNVLAFLFSLLAIIRLGRATFSLKTGWLAALFMGTIGAFQWLGYHSYPDLWVVFYLLTGLLVGVEAYREGAPNRLILAGIFVGAAAGSGYVGAVGAISLVFSLLALGGWRMLDAKRVQREDIFTLILVAIAIASPWYIRNLVWFRNPVYPFMPDVFHPGSGRYGVYGPESAVALTRLLAGSTIVNLFTSGSLLRQFASMWPVWGAIPAGIWFWRSSPFLRLGVTWCILTWGYWLIDGGLMHSSLCIYLIPVTSIAAAHLAGLLYTSPPGNRRGRFIRIVLWALLVGWAGMIAVRGGIIAPPLTENARSDFLSANLDSYDLIETANQVIPKTAVAVGVGCADARLYATFPLMGGSDVGLANHGVVADAARSPVVLAALVGGRYQASYLVINMKWLDSTERVGFMTIRNVIRTPEFARIFSEVTRTPNGVIYYLEEPQQLQMMYVPETTDTAPPP